MRKLTGRIPIGFGQVRIKLGIERDFLFSVSLSRRTEGIFLLNLRKSGGKTETAAWSRKTREIAGRRVNPVFKLRHPAVGNQKKQTDGKLKSMP